MTLRIEVEPSITGKCWLATFSGTDTTGIPTGVPIPLPFTPEATYDLVYDHLHSRFPSAVIAWPAPAPKAEPCYHADFDANDRCLKCGRSSASLLAEEALAQHQAPKAEPRAYFDTKEEAQRYAARDHNYYVRATKRGGNYTRAAWIVWDQVSDHYVEFDS